MKKRSSQANAGLSRRLHFPDDEKRIPWLAALLDAYAIVDTGVAIAIREQGKKQKKKIACDKGCGACCVHQTDLPLYPHEIVGIYWFASERMTGPAREVLKRRLVNRSSTNGCPFLIEGSCSIHPLRPVGCRQFNVFTAPCGPEEDPYFTRPDDVLRPIPEYLDRAFAAVIPFYQLNGKGDPSGAIKAIRSQILNLLSYDWSKLAELMDKEGVAAEDRR